MKKAIKISLCLVLSITIMTGFGCGPKSIPYEFFAEISEIEIVWIKYVGQEPINTNYETLYKIEDKDQFLTEFAKLKFRDLFDDDSVGLHGLEHAILIKYTDGSCDFIGYYAGERFTAQGMEIIKRYCNIEEYRDFINSYIPSNKRPMY